MRPPILIIHICAGVVGVLSGAAAMSFRKGSRPHRVGGSLFFVAMLVMGSSAAYLGNVVGGLFACYLVATAWLTARRREEETSIFDWVAFLFALALGVVLVTHGVRLATGTVMHVSGVPFGLIFFIDSEAILAASGVLSIRYFRCGF